MKFDSIVIIDNMAYGPFTHGKAAHQFALAHRCTDYELRSLINPYDITVALEREVVVTNCSNVVTFRDFKAHD
jgi:hypothetical protein